MLFQGFDVIKIMLTFLTYIQSHYNYSSGVGRGAPNQGYHNNSWYRVHALLLLLEAVQFFWHNELASIEIIDL